MRVYRWKKPCLEFSLVTGGTLSASTKYYIYGVSRMQSYSNNLDWFAASAPVSDIYEVTTTTTGTSIHATIYFQGNITAIESGDTGKLLITSPIHCLTTGNIIQITGTSTYDGTYTITDWVDYNQFMVAGTFSATGETGGWKANGLVNNLGHWYMYCYTVNPANADGTYKDTTEVKSKFTHGPGGYTAISTSGYTITSQPSLTRYTLGSTWELRPRSGFQFFLDIGYPTLAGTESSLTTTQIQTELENAGLEQYNYFPYYVTCNIWLQSLAITFPTYQPICFFATTWQTPLSTFEQTVLAGISAFNYNYTGSGAEGFRGILKNSAYLNNKLNNTTFQGLNRTYNPFQGTTGKTNVIASTNNYGWDGATSASRIFKDITYISTNTPFLMYHQNTYNAGYIVENLDLKYTHLLSSDITLGAQGSTPPYYLVLDINTERTDNLKIITAQGTGIWNAPVYLYRSRTIKVADKNNNAISGATITLHATNPATGSTYTGITDSGGTTYFEILEQLSTPIDGTQNKTALIYKDWLVTVEKDSYQTYTATADIAINVEEEITLTESIPDIYDVEVVNCTDSLTNDGEISIFASGGTTPYEYSLDGILYETGNSYINLSAGTYTVYVKDALGTIDYLEGVNVAIQPSTITVPYIYNLLITDALKLGATDGSIVVLASGGTAPYTYSLNSNPYVASNVFQNLPAGIYTISIKDDTGLVGSLSGIKVALKLAGSGGAVNRRRDENRYKKTVQVKNVTVKDVDLNEDVNIRITI